LILFEIAFRIWRHCFADNIYDAKVMADRDKQSGNQRRSLIGLGVVVCIFVIGWILARELYADSKLEDCLMSGRTNCAPINSPER